MFTLKMGKEKSLLAKFLLFLLVAQIILGLFPQGKVRAAEGSQMRFVSHGQGINLRTGPGIKYKTCGFAENNSYFEGVRQGGWFKVKVNGRPAYMAYNLTMPLDGKEIRYTGAGRANVRRDKTTKSALVKKTYLNDIHIGEREGAWFKTYMNRKPVYIAYNLTSGSEKNYETRRVSGNGINIRSSNSLGNNIVGKLYKNKEIEGVQKGNYFRFTFNERPAYIVYKWTDKLEFEPKGIEDKMELVADFKTFNDNLFYFDHGFEEANYLSKEKMERYAVFNDNYSLKSSENKNITLNVIPKSWVKIVEYRGQGESIIEFNGNKYYVNPHMYRVERIDYSNEYLKNVPFKFKRYICGMQVCSKIGENSAGTYNSVSRHINILDRYKNDMRVIIHEISHGISFNAAGQGKILHNDKKWIDIWEKEWKNTNLYGGTNPCEGFAESFTAFACGSSLHFTEDLKETRPLSYEYMENLINNLPEY